MNKIIFLENINDIKDISYNKLFFIFGKDIYLNNLIKNKIIDYIKNINYKIIYLLVNSVLDWQNLIYYNISNDLFDSKKIIVVNFNILILFEIKEYINFNLLSNNIILIIILNNIFNIKLKKYILKNFNFNKALIDCQINYKNRFIKYIISIIKKKNIKNFNLLTYNWLYSLYKDNILIIFKIIDIISKKNINNLIKIINNPIINYVNNFSWIYSNLIGNFRLSMINLFIIKNKSYLNIKDLLKDFEKYIFVIFYIKYNIYKTYESLKYFEIDFNYIDIILKSVNRLDNKSFFKIIELMKKINIYIYENNYSLNLINELWNKLELLSFIFCKNIVLKEYIY